MAQEAACEGNARKIQSTDAKGTSYGCAWGKGGRASLWSAKLAARGVVHLNLPNARHLPIGVRGARCGFRWWGGWG